MTVTDRIREAEQPGWNDGYRAGQQERSDLELRLAERDLHIALLQDVIDHAIRYVKRTDNLLEMAVRGNNVFGKRWMAITGFKPHPAKDAT